MKIKTMSAVCKHFSQWFWPKINLCTQPAYISRWDPFGKQVDIVGHEQAKLQLHAREVFSKKWEIRRLMIHSSQYLIFFLSLYGTLGENCHIPQKQMAEYCRCFFFLCNFRIFIVLIQWKRMHFIFNFFWAAPPSCSTWSRRTPPPPACRPPCTYPALPAQHQGLSSWDPSWQEKAPPRLSLLDAQQSCNTSRVVAQREVF